MARLVVLASGGGRSLENLQEQIVAGRLPARIQLVVVSRADAGARARAERLGLPCLVIGKGSHPDAKQREKILLQAILEVEPDFVIMAGWLSKLPIPPELAGRVLNIHPALLPAYGGKGFYGDRVHATVERDRPPISGCTVHFADEEYDRGPIVLQEAVLLTGKEDAAEIAAKVFEAEKRALPEALHQLIAGHAEWRNGECVWSKPQPHLNP